jgi:hypothetical protein
MRPSASGARAGRSRARAPNGCPRRAKRGPAAQGRGDHHCVPVPATGYPRLARCFSSPLLAA